MSYVATYTQFLITVFSHYLCRIIVDHYLWGTISYQNSSCVHFICKQCSSLRNVDSRKQIYNFDFFPIILLNIRIFFVVINVN